MKKRKRGKERKITAKSVNKINECIESIILLCFDQMETKSWVSDIEESEEFPLFLGQRERKITEKEPKHELLLIQSQNKGAGFTSGIDRMDLDCVIRGQLINWKLNFD